MILPACRPFSVPFSVKGSSSVIKRTFDIVVSLLAIALALPFWALVAVAVKLDSPGPVFYHATRTGQGGRPFTMFKFRTMVQGAAASGPAVTRGGDPRITRVGRILRDLKIDETPQLVNVLRGEMSIIGPRPEHPRYVAHYTPEQRRVLAVRPGIAGPAAVRYRHEEKLLAAAGGDVEAVYLTTIMPEKLRLDLEYVERQSFLYDLRLLVQGACSVFRRYSAARPGLPAGPGAAPQPAQRPASPGSPRSHGVCHQ